VKAFIIIYGVRHGIGMIMMVRDRDYRELLRELSGKNVLLWTCNTCARLSDQVGGEASAVRLSDALSKDGVNIVGILHTSASCLEAKVVSKYDAEMASKADVILSLTCDIGAYLAGKVFGLPVINPIITLGPGYIDRDGGLYVATTDGLCNMREYASERGMGQGPFI
jgi:hypothetical protein